MAINALMMFYSDKSKTSIGGDSSATVDTTNDSLATMNGDRWASFFEVEDFNFSLELAESTGEGAAGAAGASDPSSLRREIDALRADLDRLRATPGFSASRAGAGKNGDKGAKSSSSGFDDFTTAPADTRSPGYKQRLAPFTFKRQADTASLALLKGCYERVLFPQAVLIKRKDVGAGGAIGSLAYLRYDFTDVLVTAIRFGVDEVATEDVTFVCRQVDMTFLPQSGGGGIGPIGSKSTTSIKLNVTSSGATGGGNPG